MAKGEERGIPAAVTQQEKDMALQQRQPPPQYPSTPFSLGSSAAQSPYIHSMPAWVLEDFCQKMDCLNDYDWMRFGEPGISSPGGWGSSSAGFGGPRATFLACRILWDFSSHRREQVQGCGPVRAVGGGSHPEPPVVEGVLVLRR